MTGDTAKGNRTPRHRFHAKYVRFVLRFPVFHRNVSSLPPKERKYPADGLLSCRFRFYSPLFLISALCGETQPPRDRILHDIL